MVRKGSYINIGLGRQETNQLGEHVADFVAFLEQRGKIPAGLPAKFHGHAYLLHGDAPRPLLGDAVLLIGDAAAFVELLQKLVPITNEVFRHVQVKRGE